MNSVITALKFLSQEVTTIHVLACSYKGVHTKSGYTDVCDLIKLCCEPSGLLHHSTLNTAMFASCVHYNTVQLKQTHYHKVYKQMLWRCCGCIWRIVSTAITIRISLSHDSEHCALLTVLVMEIFFTQEQHICQPIQNFMCHHFFLFSVILKNLE